MTLSGLFSWLNRRNAPNAVTSSGPSQPHSALLGMGGTIRASRPDGWSVVAAAGCAVAREAIIGLMVLGLAGFTVPDCDVVVCLAQGSGGRDIAWCPA